MIHPSCGCTSYPSLTFFSLDLPFFLPIHTLCPKKSRRSTQKSWKLVWIKSSLYLIKFLSCCPPSLICFLAVWHSRFVATYWTICILHLAAIEAPGGTNWETFLCHCMSWYAVFMMNCECYVLISSFLSVTMIPRYVPSPVECVVPLDDRMNGYDSLRNWEILKISVRSGGWLIVLSMLIVMGC